MDVKGKKVTIVGMGETCLALAKLLLREGAAPFVTEHNANPKLDAKRAELDAIGVPSEMGGHSEAAFADASLIIPSPGVSPNIEPIRRAVEKGAQVIGEMECAFGYCRSRVLAVTGTNGKTTTTELLRALVASCGCSVALAGNNAFPFSAAVALDPAPEYIVLEVSSYQLETTRRFRPWIGAVLNVTPDHLKRHGNMTTYAMVKSAMFANQEQEDFAIVNVDDPLVRGMADKTRAQVRPFSLEMKLDDGLWLDGASICFGNEIMAKTSDTILPGRHNLQNVLCALAMMRAGGFDWERTLSGLREFKGVEHRIEHVLRSNGVDYYNDSKSTNIDSLKVALESFERPIVLIVGGEGKGADYRVLRELVKARVKKMITIGEDAPKLEEAFGDIVAWECAGDMDDAIDRASRAASAGDVALLSPACASFDMYDNFEHRGLVFKDSVLKKLRPDTAPNSKEEGRI
jgi:UDP-N-acetylmuramoylalanine--D-glutamate ligase